MEAEEAQRKRAEQEALKLQEEEQARKRAEEEARQRQEEEQARQRQEEEAARRRLEAEEAQRKRAEQEALKRQEEEQARKRAEEEARQRQEEEQARQRQEEEAARRRLEAEEAQRKRAEQEALKHQEEERVRQRAEEESRKRHAAEQARKQHEEAARKQHEEAARKQHELENARKQQAEQLAHKLRAEEELRKALEEQQRRIQLEEQTRFAVEAAEREASERAAREARAMAEVARRAKEEAERQARDEAAQRAREEAERKAKEAEERKRREEEARKKAEIDRMRSERRMREEALAKQREQQAERDRQVAARKEMLERNRKTPWKRIKPVLIALAVLFVAAAALLEFMPVSFLVPAFEAAAARRIGEPVSIAELNMSVVRKLQFRLTGVKIGQQLDVQAKVVTVYPEWSSLLGAPMVVKQLVVVEPTANAEGLARIAAWASRQGGQGELKVEQIQLQQARLTVKGLDVPAFDADVSLTAEGAFAGGSLRLSDGTLRAELAPSAAGATLTLNGRGFTLPAGPAAVFDEVSARGSITADGIKLSEIEGLLYGGRTKGNAALSWNGGWSLRGEFQLQRVELFPLLQTVGKTAKASGQMDANARFETSGASVGKMFDAPTAQSTFSVSGGSVDGVDLVRALQLQTREAMRGGKTRFDSLSGTLVVSGSRYQYRDLKLTSGLFTATGAVDILPSRDLGGRLAMEMKSEKGDYRSSYSLTGNLESMMLKP